MIPNITVAEAVFLITLAATFGAAFLARRHAANDGSGGLAEIKLNRWLVGLSAGTTANSGFIVTGAVGLGYAYGLQWVLLPLSWLLGDLVFWYFFPARINRFGRDSRATTLSQMLVHGLSGRAASAVGVLCALVILFCLAGYTSAQWLAGQKFLSGAFDLPDWVALGIFALLIIAYSSIGGFRGSVYTDALQAVIRIIGTIIALGAVTWFAVTDSATFWRNMASAGDGFLNIFPGGIVTTVGFVAGFAAAAIGFGLGQPQIVSRYLAGSSPTETRSAWWIYVGFVQSTWIAMTVFGLVLRGVMPGIADPETGLSVFFQKNIGAVLTGLIVADVFATIAATSNGLLIAMSQAVTHDLLPKLFGKSDFRIPPSVTTLVIGLTTMLLSISLHGSVVSVALSSISLIGAGLAAAVMIKVMNWRHSAASLLGAIATGVCSAILWKQFGMSGYFNEAGIGMTVGLAANFLISQRAIIAKTKIQTI
ncbi:sodium:solute symporter family transporter [Rhodoblastus sp.]|uniref:sodium:solute symporter family transporter n=1 Tax=Rhodoblastus sp. TaxID=1962975 RepID=UPI003F98ECAC